MNTKVERRFQNGFSVLQSFSWSKEESANSFIGPQTLQPIIFRQLSTDDKRFHYVLTPVYELPFGRGRRYLNHTNRLMDELIGGWSFNGIYQFQSGMPLNLPTNSAFYEGGSFNNQGFSPSLHSAKTSAKWFDTSKFMPFPSSSTCASNTVGSTACKAAAPASTLAGYPSWTGVQSMPGYSWVPGASGVQNGVYNDFATRVTYNQQVFGDIRNPYVNTFTIGARKRFAIAEGVRFELGMDAFNALNHPQFGNINTSPTSSGFGMISGTTPSGWVQVNSPRLIQIRGTLTF
jgi:hypothetical protein